MYLECIFGAHVLVAATLEQNSASVSTSMRSRTQPGVVQKSSAPNPFARRDEFSTYSDLLTAATLQTLGDLLVCENPPKLLLGLRKRPHT